MLYQVHLAMNGVWAHNLVIFIIDIYAYYIKFYYRYLRFYYISFIIDTCIYVFIKSDLL